MLNLSNVKRLGIMGGSFNPPHIGHFIMAESALGALGLDKVMFIPSGRVAYKSQSGRADGFHRYEMLKTVVKRNPGFCITDMEIARDETTYTANTLGRLSQALPDTKLYFIVGADSLDYMDEWYRPQVIFGLCTVAVMRRSGIAEDRLTDKIKYLSSEFSADICTVDMPGIDVSSTEIRRRIRDGETIRYLCDDEVIEYINKNGLYMD